MVMACVHKGKAYIAPDSDLHYQQAPFSYRKEVRMFRYTPLCCSRFLLVLVTIILGLSSPLSLAQETSLPFEIQEALAKNAQVFSPMTIQWKRQRHGKHNAETLAEKWGEFAYGLYQSQEGVSCFQDNMFYSRRTVLLPFVPMAKHKGKGIEKSLAYSFDGKCLFFSTEKPYKGITLCSREDIEKSDESYTRYANQFPKEIRRIGFVLLPDCPLASIILFHVKHGGKVISVTNETIDGSSCTIVKLSIGRLGDYRWKDRQEVYYLEPHKNYAVKQIDWISSDGRLICRTRNSDWMEFKENELWLPRFSSCQWHTDSLCDYEILDDVFFYEDFSLEFKRKNYDRIKFSPDLDEPGLNVVDARSEAESKPGAFWNEHLKGWEYTNPPDLPGLQSSKAKPFRIVLIVVGVVLIGLVIFLTIYRARKA